MALVQEPLRSATAVVFMAGWISYRVAVCCQTAQPYRLHLVVDVDDHQVDAFLSTRHPLPK
jgi:hypothetical protein